MGRGEDAVGSAIGLTELSGGGDKEFRRKKFWSHSCVIGWSGNLNRETELHRLTRDKQGN